MRIVLACQSCRAKKIKCVHDGKAPCQQCKAKRAACTLEYPLLSKKLKAGLNVSKSSGGSSTADIRNRKAQKHTVKNSVVSSTDPMSFHDAQNNSPSENPMKPICDSRSTKLKNPIDKVTKLSLRRAWESVANLFPEFLFIHKPTMMTATLETHEQILTVIVALCGYFCPIQNDEYIGVDSPLVKDEEVADYALSKLVTPESLMGEPSIEVVQCLLMLSIYYWGKNNLYRSWMIYGMATGMLDSFDLHLNPTSSSVSLLEQEVNIRTLWSCFLIDRTIAIGKNRSYLFVNTRIKDIPLPKSEEVFLHTRSGSNVLPKCFQNYQITLNSFEKGSDLDGQNYSGVFLIQIFEIWGEIVQWILDGGRRTSHLPPWSPDSFFDKKQKSLANWYNHLPDYWRWTDDNFTIHQIRSSESQFATINCVYHLCVLYLEREYTPFLPYDIRAPSGPIEEPMLSTPPDAEYWNSGARKLFCATRQISRIIELLHVSFSDCLLSTPFLMFSSFCSATVSLYGYKFSWMDPDYELTKSDPERALEVCASKMLEFLLETKSKLLISEKWYFTLTQIEVLFDFVINNPVAARQLKLGRNTFKKLEDSLSLMISADSPSVKDSINNTSRGSVTGEERLTARFKQPALTLSAQLNKIGCFVTQPVTNDFLLNDGADQDLFASILQDIHEYQALE